DDFRDARRIVNFRCPFRHGPEHGTIIELLECLAIAHIAANLPDKHDHRGGILARDMNAGRRVAGAWSTRDKTDAGPAGYLAHSLRHDGRGAFVAADGKLDVAIVESVERGKVAFARHAKDIAHALDRQLVDQDFAAGTCVVLAAHPNHFTIF